MLAEMAPLKPSFGGILLTRPGKHTKNDGNIHHFVKGFLSTFSTGPFSSSQTVNVYQKVYR